jgi:methyl-accepting chemotaxis protein
MKYSSISIILICLSFIFYTTLEIIETGILLGCPIIFSITKTLILFALNITIIMSLKYNHLDCVFIWTVINLTFSCILFFFHILFEISEYEDTDTIYFNIVIALNLFFIFSALFASIFLFLMRNEILKAINNTKRLSQNKSSFDFTTATEELLIEDKEIINPVCNKKIKNKFKKSKFHSCINVVSATSKRHETIMVEQQPHEQSEEHAGSSYPYNNIQIISSLKENSKFNSNQIVSSCFESNSSEYYETPRNN